MKLTRKWPHAAMALIAIASITAGAAQVPEFAFRVPLEGVSGGPASNGTTLVPPGQATSGGPADFDSGTASDYQVRTVVGEPFSLELSTINGTPPISWLPGPTDLPSGISYSDGVLSGYARAPFAGVRSFTAQDSVGKQATGNVAFEIVEPAVSLSGVNSFVRVGAPYVGNLASNVRGAAYTLSGAPGIAATAPDGNSRASLAGIATTPGTFPVTATVGRPGTTISASSQASTVRVAPGLQLAFSPAFVPATSGAQVDVEATTSGVVGTGTLTLVSPAASILSQRGLSFAGGRLTGTLATGAAVTLTVRLTDSEDSSSTTASLAIPALDGSAAIEIGEMRPGTAPEASPGQPARVATTIADPVCTTTQAVPGITVTGDCLVTGAPTTPGSYTLGVSIVPAANPQATPVLASSNVVVHPTLSASSPAPEHNAAPGVPVNLSLSPSGIVGTPSFQLVGTTPQALAAIGLTFNPATGSVTGTPDAGVDVGFEIEVTDSRDGAKVRGAFRVVTGSTTTSMDTSAVQLRPGTVVTRTATTNLANAVWSLVGAPSFVTIEPNTGVVTYTGPAISEAVTMQPFAVRASNATRPQLFQDVTVAVPGVARPNLALPNVSVTGTIGQAITPVAMPLSGAGNPGSPVVNGANGLLGLSIANGQIQGTPTQAGIVTRSVTYTDQADGLSVTATVSLSIAKTLTVALPATTTYTGTPNAVLTAGAATHAGSTSTVTWTIEDAAGNPVPGFSITQAGVISGTSASSGSVAVYPVATQTGQSTKASSPVTFTFVASDASTTRPYMAIVHSDSSWRSASGVPALYDESDLTGITIFSGGSATKALRIYFNPAMPVNCVMIRGRKGGGSLTVDNEGSTVGVPMGTSDGTYHIAMAQATAPIVTVSFQNSQNGQHAYIHEFQAGIMQANNTCKTAP